MVLTATHIIDRIGDTPGSAIDHGIGTRGTTLGGRDAGIDRGIIPPFMLEEVLQLPSF